MSARPRFRLLFMPTAVCRPNQVVCNQVLSLTAALSKYSCRLSPPRVRSRASLFFTAWHGTSHQISTAIAGSSLAVHFAKVGQARDALTLRNPAYSITARVSAARASISEIGTEIYARLLDKTTTASTALKRVAFQASAEAVPAGTRVVPTAGGGES